MITVGIMVTLEVAILGIDYPILLGLIAGICEIIPLLGPAIAIAVLAAIAFPLGWGKITLAVIIFLAIQQISNYVIRPLLFGKFMKLHPINIMVAIFVAEEFLGVWGVILSPAIAATICVLIDELYLTPINEKETGNNLE
jgi:predicted PurR-regulated permease PerM